MRKSQENNNKKTILWWKNLPSLRAWICAGIPVIKPTSLGVFDVWKNAGWCDRGRCIRISHILIFLNLPQLLSVFFSVESCFFFHFLGIVQKKIYCTLCLGTIPTFFRSDGFPSWKPKKKRINKNWHRFFPPRSLPPPLTRTPRCHCLRDYQPKQGTMTGKSLGIYHAFALFVWFPENGAI